GQGADEGPDQGPEQDPEQGPERGDQSARQDADDGSDDGSDDGADDGADDGSDDQGERRARRRRRGGRGRRGRGRDGGPDEDQPDDESEQPAREPRTSGPGREKGPDGSSTRRRRRRRRGSAGEEGEPRPDDPPNTVVRVREPRGRDEEPGEVQSVKGSTRLEAKKQRRREGREQGRRRPPVITEAEFLARREAVDRTMVVRHAGDRTQIAVLEDDVLVEHYITHESHASFVGNVYLGKVQNVLPSMEAAFVDIGKGRNAVLYAGEVNFDAADLDGQPKRIESVLKPGQSVVVQVTKDPIAHKGARLTSQVSLPGRYLVYVPQGSMTGISRKLPDTERSRLKSALKKIVPEDAGVIVRTAAEGASEDELQRDISRLESQWAEIGKKAKSGNAPALLHGEPDLTVRVIRDIFNEDFSKVVVSGADAWKTVHDYVSNVAPDLAPRLSRWTPRNDVFAEYRVDEQLAKALDRKVWLPSGGSLVIERTEAMVVIDVNTGKFTGKGGNLEETVTKNNLEAAEEIVRQLRLRDLGGIIVIDFIDMVLESNRELVLRRLLECLGRDRTKHQVAEVTSLGLVQMTRKRVGQGLLEAFSEICDRCNGRGVIVRTDAVSAAPAERPARRRRKAARGAEPAQESQPPVEEGSTAEPAEVADPDLPDEQAARGGPAGVADVEPVSLRDEASLEEPAAPQTGSSPHGEAPAAQAAQAQSVETQSVETQSVETEPAEAGQSVALKTGKRSAKRGSRGDAKPPAKRADKPAAKRASKRQGTAEPNPSS
ncbi:MAG: Rne/Rng family ribonuclease, partial [Streptomycetales bacterium]